MRVTGLGAEKVEQNRYFVRRRQAKLNNKLHNYTSKLYF